MDSSPRSVSITSPQKCIFKWLLKDVLKQPTIKLSPSFDMVIGQAKEQILLSLNTNHNMMQISLKPTENIDLPQLVELISDASIVFRFGGNQSKIFDKQKFRVTGDLIVFEVNRMNFSVLTNDYKDPFEIELQLNLQPPIIAPVSEEQRAPSSQSSSSSETATSPNELVQMVWELKDVKEQPLIKESPIFSFNIGLTKHQVRFSMDINNDRVQIRITPCKTSPKQFADLIKSVSASFQPSDKRPLIKSDNLEVRKVLPDTIYLRTIKLSFAEMTDNHQSPLSVTLHFSFRKELKNTSSVPAKAKKEQVAGIISYEKPYPFFWRIIDHFVFPYTKTSPIFKMQMSNKSMLSVQLLLMHNRNEPIRLCLTAERNGFRSALASSIKSVSIKITDANNLEIAFKDVVPRLDDEHIWFDLFGPHLSFAELTNEFRDPFRILFLFYRSTTNEASSLSDRHTAAATIVPDQPIAPIPSTIHQPTIDATLFLPNPQPSALLCQLNTLLVDQVDCDIHFDCQGTIIGAHKTILRTRSPFFKELLLQHHDQSVFPFKSVDAETMADTLQFIYTGAAPRIASTAERLLSVANLMELPDLHQLAQTHLLEKRPVNAIPTSRESIAKLLDLFEIRRTQDAVGTFIQTNLVELMGNAHFEQELKERPALCYDLLTSFHVSNKTEV